MSVSDEALIARVVKKQDQHGFSQLVLRYQSKLRLWARRLCDGDSHLADDLAQETFIKAYAALPAFRADSKFSTWLYRIAFNVAATRWRAKKIEWTALPDEEHLGSVDENAAADATRDVEMAMLQLSSPQQLAVRLYYQDGFSHSEIAEIMGIPLGTVKTHLLRAKQKLEVHLNSWRSAI